MTATIALPLDERAALAFTALALVEERKAADDMGLTDSDVLDVIDSYAVGTCPEDRACTGDACCDLAALGVAVWALVEAGEQGDVDPGSIACDACGAEPFEACRPGCIGEAAAQDEEEGA